MFFHEIIRIFRSGDIDAICNLVNSSIYMEDYSHSPNTRFIHTGFFIKIKNTGNYMEFLYHVSAGKLLRQPLLAKNKEEAAALIRSGQMKCAMGLVYHCTPAPSCRFFTELGQEMFNIKGVEDSDFYLCKRLNEDNSTVAQIISYTEARKDGIMEIIFNKKTYQYRRASQQYVFDLKMNGAFVFSV